MTDPLSTAGDIARARRTMKGVAPTDPDEHAMMLRKASGLGISPRVARAIQNQGMAYQKRQADGNWSGLDELLASSHRAARWLGNPDNAATVQDDVRTLTTLSRHLRGGLTPRSTLEEWGESTWRGFKGLQSSYFALAAAYGIVDPTTAAHGIHQAREAQEDSERFRRASVAAYFDRLDRSTGLGIIPTAFSSPDGMVNSILEMLGFMAPAALGTVAGFALGGPTLAAVGSFGGGVFAEQGAWMTQEFADSGYDTRTVEGLEQALRDPGVMGRAYIRGAAKGIGTAGVDALATMLAVPGMGGRIAGTLGRTPKTAAWLAKVAPDALKEAPSIARRVAQGVGAFGGQAVLEGVGEAVGQVAATGSFDLDEVILESVAGMGMGALRLGAGRIWAGTKGAAKFGVRQAAKAAVALTDSAAVKDMGAALKASPIPGRSPDIAASFIRNELEGQAEEDYAARYSIEDWNARWDDPAAELERVLPGRGRDMHRNGRSTGSIAIPLPEFLVAYKDHADFADLVDTAAWREDGPSLVWAATEASPLVSDLEDEILRTQSLYQEEAALAREIDELDEKIAATPVEGQAAAPVAPTKKPSKARPTPTRAKPAAEGPLGEWRAEQLTQGFSEEEVDAAIAEATARGVDPTRSDNLHSLEAFLDAPEEIGETAAPTREALIAERAEKKAQLDQMVEVRQRNEQAGQGAYEDIRQQLLDAGRKTLEAEMGARIYAGALGAFAKRTGMTIEKLRERFPTRVVRGAALEGGESAPAAETRSPPPPAASPGLVGRETEILTASGTYPARYEVRELSDIRPSHQVAPGAGVYTFTEDPEYPAGLQPRPYHRLPAEQAKVETFVANMPERVMLYLGDSGTPTDGSPIVAPDGTVINGNGRAMALKLAEQIGGESIEAYRSRLALEAARYDVDPAAVEGMESPVLVRVVGVEAGSAEAVRFAREGNEPLMQAQATPERMKAMAESIPPEALTLRIPEDMTVGEFLSGGTAAARGALAKIEQAIPENLRPGFFSEPGVLTTEGKVAIGELALAAVLDREATRNQRPGVEAMIHKAIPAMAAARAELVDDLRITGDLEAALAFGRDELADWHQAEGQKALIGGDPWEALTPTQASLVRAIQGNVRRDTALRNILQAYVSFARGSTMMGQAAVTREEALAEALDRTNDGARPPQAAEPAVLAQEDFKAAKADFLQVQEGVSVEDLFERSPAAQDELVAAAETIAASTGARLKDPGVKGKSAKGRQRTAQKIRDDYGGDASRISDVVRVGFTVESPEQAEAVVRGLAARFPALDKGWDPTPVGYFDRKVLVQVGGLVAEVQIWEPALIEAKDKRGGHAMYEEARSPDTPPERRAALEAEMARLYEGALESASPAWAPLVSGMASEMGGVFGNVAANFSAESSVPLRTSEEIAGARPSPEMVRQDSEPSSTTRSTESRTAGRSSQDQKVRGGAGIGEPSGESIPPIGQWRLFPEPNRGNPQGPSELFQTAFHGSPHRFDRFSTEAIGTGEGAQAYGWGLYFADKRGVAKAYRDALAQTSRAHTTFDGKRMTPALLGEYRISHDPVARALASIPSIRPTAQGDQRTAVDAAIQSRREQQGALQELIDARLAGPKPIAATYSVEDYRKQIAGLGREVTTLEAVKSRMEFVPEKRSGALFTVELAPQEDEYLLWDAPLSEQSEKVQAILERNDDEGSQLVRAIRADANGRELYMALVQDMGGDRLAEQDASEGLAAAGIPGIKYLDQGSRNKTREFKIIAPDGHVDQTVAVSREAAEEVLAERSNGRPGWRIEEDLGSYNYVIFDDRLIEITKLEQGPGRLPGHLLEDLAARIFSGTLDEHVEGGDVSEGTAALLKATFDGEGRRQPDPRADLTPEAVEWLVDEIRDIADQSRDIVDQTPTDDPQYKKWRRAAREADAVADRLEAGEGLLEQERRGVTRFPEEPDDHGRRWFDIHFLAKANRSTLIHELGHVFSIMLGDLASDPDAPQQIRDDWAALQAHVGAVPGQPMTEQQHELWARSFEAYLMEGKAPSEELRSAFAAFRDFLVRIYRNLQGLIGAGGQQIQLTDDVRELMDRLLATDEEIAAVQYEVGLPSLPAEALNAMTDDERAKHERRARRIKEVALARFDRDSLRSLEDQKDRLRGEAMEAAKAEASSALDATPAGMAHRQMLAGEMPKLDRTATHALLGATDKRTAALEAQGLLTDKGGLSPREAAEAVGLAVPEELLTSMARLQRREVLLERIAREKVRAEQPELLSRRESLSRARKHLANEHRVAHLERQGRTLRRLAAREARRADEAEGRADRAAEDTEARREAFTPTRTIAHIREQARAIIARTPLGELRPKAFVAQAGKQSRLTARKVRAGKWLEAAESNDRELLNLELFRIAQKAQDKAQKTEKHLRRIGKPNKGPQKKLIEAGWEYADAANGILSRFGFGVLTPDAIDRRVSLPEWIAARKADPHALEPDIVPWLLDERIQMSVKQLTPQALEDVRDAVDQIVHFAKHDLTGEFLASTGRKAVAKGEVLNRLEAGRKAKPIRIGKKQPWVSEFQGTGRAIDSIARQIDGEQGGPLWRWLVRPLIIAAQRETDMGKNANADLEAAFKLLSKEDRKDWNTYKQLPGVSVPLTLQNRVMVALNWGNAEGRDRLRHRFQESEIEAIMESLEQRHADFAEKVWVLEDSYWPEAQELWRKMKGMAPPKVRAIPFQTRGGAVTWRGGYHRIKYEGREHEESLDLSQQGAAITRGDAIRATTRSGSQHERLRQVSEHLQVRLDFGVVVSHLSETIHVLTHAAALRDVQAVALDREVREAIESRYGKAIYQQFPAKYKNVAAGTWAANDVAARGLGYLRAGSVVMRLGMKTMTNLINTGGLTQSAVRVGAGPMSEAIAMLLREPDKILEVRRKINAVDLGMRNRSRTFDRAISEQSNRFVKRAGGKSPADAITLTSFLPLAATQAVVDTPTWLAAFSKAGGDIAMLLHGDPENVIELYADEILQAYTEVVGAQGGGEHIFLADIQEGSEWKKLWTTFYGFSVRMMNVMAESTEDIRRNPKDLAAYGVFATKALMLIMLPAFYSAVLQNMLRGDEEEDETLFSTTGWEGLSYTLGMWVGLREFSALPLGINQYSGTAGTAFFSEAMRLIAQVGQGEADEGAVRAFMSMAGILGHLPTSQMMESWRGMEAWLDGKAPISAILVGAPRGK